MIPNEVWNTGRRPTKGRGQILIRLGWGHEPEYRVINVTSKFELNSITGWILLHDQSYEQNKSIS